MNSKHPELGEKHICDECGTKFYDLQRKEIVCPKCGAHPTGNASNPARRKRRLSSIDTYAPNSEEELEDSIDEEPQGDNDSDSDDDEEDEEDDGVEEVDLDDDKLNRLSDLEDEDDPVSNDDDLHEFDSDDDDIPENEVELDGDLGPVGGEDDDDDEPPKPDGAASSPSAASRTKH